MKRDSALIRLSPFACQKLSRFVRSPKRIVDSTMPDSRRPRLAPGAARVCFPPLMKTEVASNSLLRLRVSPAGGPAAVGEVPLAVAIFHMASPSSKTPPRPVPLRVWPSAPKPRVVPQPNPPLAHATRDLQFRGVRWGINE
jgi:hypothetical protein